MQKGHNFLVWRGHLGQSWGAALLEQHHSPAFFALPWGLMPQAQLPSAHTEAFASLNTPFLTHSLENRMRSIGPSVPAGSQRRLICGTEIRCPEAEEIYKEQKFRPRSLVFVSLSLSYDCHTALWLEETSRGHLIQPPASLRRKMMTL